MYKLIPVGLIGAISLCSSLAFAQDGQPSNGSNASTTTTTSTTQISTMPDKDKRHIDIKFKKADGSEFVGIISATDAETLNKGDKLEISDIYAPAASSATTPTTE